MLKRPFFERDPLSCARELIGCRLKWGTLSGIVVETEAYDVEGDEACHTFSRPSARLFVSRHDPGVAYVYFSYGVHWMLNVLVKGKRLGFVLIRALEPIEGIDQMKRARGTQDLQQLCSGPGKLAMALGVTGGHHGRDLCADQAFSFSAGRKVQEVEASPRVGISRAVELPWRFYAAGNPHVSRLSFVRAGRNGILPGPRN
ncbi:MAG TPA: DNA-3-methyladenine glycosylase [Terrimicrobiaceae bacterium]